MSESEPREPSTEDTTPRTIEDLRRRSQLRLWWSSARVALRRGQSEKPSTAPQPAVTTHVVFGRGGGI